MNLSFSGTGSGEKKSGGGSKRKPSKAQLVSEARKARAQRAKAMEAQREADRQRGAARVLQRAARRCACVRRLHLRKLLGDEVDADLAAGERAGAGSLYRLCRRLMLFCDLSLIADAARFRKMVLRVLKQLGEYCSYAVSDPQWFHHAARFGGFALQKLGATQTTGAGGNSADFAPEVRLLVALTDSAGWRIANSDAAKAKAASTRVLGTLVSVWELHTKLRTLLVGCNCLATEPLWAQAVLTLAARPVLVLDGAAKLDAVRRLVMSQLTVPGLGSTVPTASLKPMQVVLPAVLQWLSVPKLQAGIARTSRVAVAANCVTMTLANNRSVSLATLQRLVAVIIGLLQGELPNTASLATEQEAAQLAAAWHPRIVKMLSQATAGSCPTPQLETQGYPCSSKTDPAHLPWAVTCEVEAPPSTVESVTDGQQDACMFFSMLHEAITPFPNMQNELVSNLCAVSEPSLLAIVWDVLVRGDAKGNLASLLAAAAVRNLGSHSLFRPLQLFLRMGLLVYVVLRDDEILGGGQQMPSFPLPFKQLQDALNLLNQIAFRSLWDGDGLPFPQEDRDIVNRSIKLLGVLYQVDERARVKGTEVMPESRWRIGSSKLSKMFETELIRRSGRATAIATQMPHLPKRSAAQRLAAAERRRTAFSSRSDPSHRAEALRLQGLEAVARVDFQTAMQCLCAAIELDSKNFLAFANRSSVLCSLGESTAALDDARKCIALAKDSPAGYMRLAMAQTELNDLPNAKANFDIAASLAPKDVRLAHLARDAEKRLQLQVEESQKRVQRMADAERKAQERALAKKAAIAKVREDERKRQEREKAIVANKKAAMDHAKAQRHEDHVQRQIAEKQRREARRAVREEERANRSEIKAQEVAQRQRIEEAAEKKRQAAELVRQKAEVEAARKEAEQARVTSLKWKKTIKERQLLNEEKIRMLAKQRQERRKMEREHAAENEKRARQVAAILASSGAAVPSEYLCPLSGSIMLHPVTASDGYQYEKSAIATWQTKNDTSPMTDERMTKWLVPHHSLQSTIEKWLAGSVKTSHQQKAPRTSERPTRNKPLVSASEPEPEPEPEQQQEQELTTETEAVDPISLEPLSSLRYPAFNLPKDGEDGSHPELYDARVLSNYLVSSGNFCHPTSRRPLQRAECQRMDTFIRKHRLGRPCVAASFDHHSKDAESAGSHAGTIGDDLAEQRRGEASDILRTLFGESAADDSLRIVDHALHVEQQAEELTALTDDDFPSLQ